MRVRGLKFLNMEKKVLVVYVAPRAGAWIEIGLYADLSEAGSVAPRAGAWIEMFTR